MGIHQEIGFFVVNELLIVVVPENFSTQPVRNIAEVSYSSQELNTSSGLVRQSAANLNNLTATLQGITGRFKV